MSEFAPDIEFKLKSFYEGVAGNLGGKERFIEIGHKKFLFSAQTTELFITELDTDAIVDLQIHCINPENLDADSKVGRLRLHEGICLVSVNLDNSSFADFREFVRYYQNRNGENIRLCVSIRSEGNNIIHSVKEGRWYKVIDFTYYYRE